MFDSKKIIFRSEANTLDKNKIVFKAKRTRSIERKFFSKQTNTSDSNKKYFRVIKICIIFLPPSLFSASQFRGWIPHPRPDIAFSPHVNSAKSRRSGVGGGLGSPLAGFSPNTEISFL